MEIAVGGLLADITLLPEGEAGDLTPTALLLKSDVFWIKSASSISSSRPKEAPLRRGPSDELVICVGFQNISNGRNPDQAKLKVSSVVFMICDTELGPERQLKTQAPLTTEIKCTDTGDASAEFPAVSESKEAIGTLSDKGPFSV
ncbi:unnamed protein product [Aphanomyces euteiches]